MAGDTGERLILRNSDDYRGKNVLAPMVRTGTLPMRLLAADYGADITYGEELVDRKMMGCRRVENDRLKTVDFIDKNDRVVFRTNEVERGRMVFQIGTGDAVSALKAAEVVCGDVAAIDINMGCPKHFSTSGGMGSQLLSKPETIRDIMTTLRRNLPASQPVTCKIRLLDKLPDTIELVRMIESTGVTALGVHGRYIPERPRQPAHWDLIKEVVSVLSIPVIANGDVFEYKDFQRMREETGAASAMCARAAFWNPSVFRAQGKLPVEHVKKEYLKSAFRVENDISNTKYVLKEMVCRDPEGAGLETPEGRRINKCKKLFDLASMYDLQDDYREIMKSLAREDRKRVASNIESNLEENREDFNSDEPARKAVCPSDNSRQLVPEIPILKQKVQGANSSETPASEIFHEFEIQYAEK